MRSIVLGFLALCLPIVSMAAAPLPADRKDGVTGGDRPPLPVSPVSDTDRIDPNVFHPGPIRVSDAATQERITSLYREQWDLQRNALARLVELGKEMHGAQDAPARSALNQVAMQLKKDLERRNMELGLEIAQLNGDEQRAAEFQTALDQLLHPESRPPVNAPDPELQARRLRELGINP